MVHAGDSPLLQSGKILISRSVRLVPLKKRNRVPSSPLQHTKVFRLALKPCQSSLDENLTRLSSADALQPQ